MPVSLDVPPYHTDLRAPVTTVVGPEPHAKVHRQEIVKVCAAAQIDGELPRRTFC